MKISFNWLKDYTDIKVPPKKLIREFTLRCAEVEKAEHLAATIEGVVVGQIMALHPHPQADRLQIAEVTVGKKDHLNIVCGGTNIAVGQKVPVAMIGAKLPGGTTIHRAAIRGHESEGMLCSAPELGLPSEGERKILILDPAVKLGQDIVKILGLGDWILELNVPANRGDLTSHVGVAREVAAIFQQKFSLAHKQLPKPKKADLGQLTLTIKDKKACPRYSALVIDRINIQPSPQWLQNRLRTIGIRPINSVVDVTNYIMADMGQPLHAFDYHKIAGPGKKMTVQAARQGEKVTTLDGTERSLTEGMTIIADEEQPIDLAGIMGGASSAINEHTTTIILQAAIFEAGVIRSTSRRLGHRTDAVSYYEKGIDPELPLRALTEAFHLLKEIDPHIELINTIDEGKKKVTPQNIIFDPHSVIRLAGVAIEDDGIMKILKNLDFEIAPAADKKWKVTVPSFRLDLESEHDLVEEALRFYGYDTIVATLPQAKLQAQSFSPLITALPDIKRFLAGYGFYEVINYSFISDKWQQWVASRCSIESIRVSNPLSEEQRSMRTELLSGLLANTRDNLRSLDQLKLFELGKVYQGRPGMNIEEYWQLGGIIAAKQEEQRNNLFFELKETVQEFLRQFLQDAILFQSAKNPGEAIITYQDKNIGRIFLLEKSILSFFDVEGAAAFFELDIEAILELRDNKKPFTPYSDFPPVKLDIAFVVNKKHSFADLEKIIRKQGQPYLARVELFDRFEQKGDAADRQSLAIHLHFQSREKTLTLEEAKQLQEKITKALKKSFSVEIR